MSSSASSSAVAAAPRKLRPARRQVKKGEIAPQADAQSGKEYNIWYNKRAGGDKEDGYKSATLSLTRCVLMRDAGYTRADAMGTKYCCLYFARGCCPLGSDCTFLHRLPPPSHILPDAALDCFARDKYADYRDDMGGVGSFGRVNRTLYIGRIRESGTKSDTEAMLRRHFSEWGELYRLNVLHTKGVAFVTYTSELCAQFAKEAMSNQSLDSAEILNVRWATEDPNPGQIKAEKRRVEAVGKKAIEGKIEGGFAEAALTVQALEEGREGDLYPLEGGGGGGAEREEGPLKRRRLEEEEEQEEVQEEVHVAEDRSGLLDRDALEGMKYFLQMKRLREDEERKAGGAAGKKAAAGAAPKGLGTLGGYGSGSEDDDEE
ncbi:hypothetical protein BDY24DRAFT_350868 [Mrakia frigida]|uniref:active spliceosome conformation promoter CWC2 n=1 Tax=Mrakia frigida TaxID=29902 RepID=UPI003FCBF2F5